MRDSHRNRAAKKSVVNMLYSLNSLKRVIFVILYWSLIGITKGDTGTLGYIVHIVSEHAEGHIAPSQIRCPKPKPQNPKPSQIRCPKP